MACPIRPLPFKPPRLRGLSAQLLGDRYERGVARRRLNAVDGRLAERVAAGASGVEPNAPIAEQRRRADAVTPHEADFDSLGGADGRGGPTEPRVA